MPNPDTTAEFQEMVDLCTPLAEAVSPPNVDVIVDALEETLQCALEILLAWRGALPPGAALALDDVEVPLQAARDRVRTCNVKARALALT